MMALKLLCVLSWSGASVASNSYEEHIDGCCAGRNELVNEAVEQKSGNRADRIELCKEICDGTAECVSFEAWPGGPNSNAAIEPGCTFSTTCTANENVDDCVNHDLYIKEVSSDGACFHGDGTVLLESGASKRFSELSLGERIKTSDGQGGFSFSPVLALPHANNTEPAAFLTLTTESGKKVDMTSDHFIPKCDQQDVAAGELSVGDCLITVDGMETLMEISSTAKNGVFTAITQDKFIVVNGFVASPFSKDSDPAKPELDYKKYRLELEQSRERKLAHRASKLQKRLLGRTSN